MRLFRRFKSAWTAFLIIFSIAGVMLTYKQLNDSRSEGRRKNYLGELVEGGDINFGPVPPGMDKPRYPEVDIMEVQALKHNMDRQKDKIQALRKIEHPSLDTDKYFLIKNLLKRLYPDDWGKAPEADEMAMDAIQNLNDLGFESPMSCKDIDSLRISASFRVGKKKYVDRAYVLDKGVEVIMKSQANDLDIKVKCLQSMYDQEKCSAMGNYLLLREILWFSVLKHDGIVDLLGYCIRGDQVDQNVRKKGIMIITEPGVPVMPSTFNVLRYKERLMYARQLSELLHYLEHHPMGSLALANIYNSDFVITTGNKLKLVDMDDLVIGEKSCRFNADCKIPGASLVKVTCGKAGKCVNRNAKLNLKIMGPLMFEPMLVNAPLGYTTEVDKLRHSIISLSVTNDELLEALKALEKKYVEPVVQQPPQIRQEVNNQIQQQHNQHNQDPFNQANVNQPNRGQQGQQDQVIVKDGDYERISQSNYPGKYDFQCPLSRVAWGCVVTVRSLKEAKSTCNAEPKCQAFVLFTSQPEADVLMTLVLKNSRFGTPEKNVGATLFVYKSKAEMDNSQQNLANQVPAINNNQVNPAPVVNKDAANQVPVVNNNLANQDIEPAVQKPSASDLAECINHNRGSSKDARKSRERRLMAHIGLKNITEDTWQQKMKLQKIVNHNGLNSLTSLSTVGGRFNVTMIGEDNDGRLRDAVFLAEIGPSQYHLAYYMVYKLDRLLGLYHTPPSALWYMTRNEVDIVRGDDTWKQRLNLVAPNSDIRGVLSVNLPPIIKQENMLIKEQQTVVQEVNTFTRTERMQLEYVFLWYLTKIYHSSDTYAYKGHMIQFSGDGAFQDLTVKLVPYLNNCQFPNVIYKMLACFKCHYSGKSRYSICGLGEEVIRLVEEDGFSLTGFKIHHMTPKVMVNIINEAAAEILDTVDTCIHTHTREKVLY